MIFTIAGRRRGRKRTGNCLLALAGRAGPAACVAPLVLGRRGWRAAVLLLLLRRGWWWCAGSIEYVGHGRAGRSGAGRGGRVRAQTRVRRAGGALESLLHISDARLESLELRGSRVDLLLPARDGLGLLIRFLHPPSRLCLERQDSTATRTLVCGRGRSRVGETYRLSTFSSRSATLFSIRKISISSREKERAMVLFRRRVRLAFDVRNFGCFSLPLYVIYAKRGKGDINIDRRSESRVIQLSGWFSRSLFRRESRQKPDPPQEARERGG